jgi:hypothetical protein
MDNYYWIAPIILFGIIGSLSDHYDWIVKRYIYYNLGFVAGAITQMLFR